MNKSVQVGKVLVQFRGFYHAEETHYDGRKMCSGDNEAGGNDRISAVEHRSFNRAPLTREPDPKLFKTVAPTPMEAPPQRVSSSSAACHVLAVLRCARAARASAFGVPVRALRVARAAPCIEIRRCSVGKGTKWSVQSGGSALRTRFPAERCTAAAATRPMAVPVHN